MCNDFYRVFLVLKNESIPPVNPEKIVGKGFKKKKEAILKKQ